MAVLDKKFPYTLLCAEEGDTSQVPHPDIAGESWFTMTIPFGRMVVTVCAGCAHCYECEFGMRISLPVLKPPFPE
jgi:hypothetical protein